MSGTRRLIVSSIVRKGGSKSALDKCLMNSNEEAAKKVTAKAVKPKK